MLNPFPSVKFDEEDLPSDSYTVGRDQAAIFHGALAYHPASSPLTQLNASNKTALKMLFKGSGSDKFVNTLLDRNG